MKLILTLLCLFAAFSNGIISIMGADFMSGFETGIFIRGQPNMIKDYGCKKPGKKEVSKEMKDVRKKVAGAVALAKFSKNKNLDQALGAFDVLLDNIEPLTAVFDETYKGTEYCSGVIFGMNGASMLMKILDAVK
jgi:hypothetical protein